jgi:metallo-beta-lactamase class B
MGALNEVHKRGIKSYSQVKTREIARMKNLPVPGYEFENSLTLSLDDKEIICNYFGAGHTIDNIVVWIPEEKILFGGCMVKSLRSRNLGNTADAVIDEWPNTLKKVLETYPESKIVIPGHGEYGDLSLVHHTLELLGKN